MLLDPGSSHFPSASDPKPETLLRDASRRSPLSATTIHNASKLSTSQLYDCMTMIDHGIHKFLVWNLSDQNYQCARAHWHWLQMENNSSSGMLCTATPRRYSHHQSTSLPFSMPCCHCLVEESTVCRDMSRFTKFGKTFRCSLAAVNILVPSTAGLSLPRPLPLHSRAADRRSKQKAGSKIKLLKRAEHHLAPSTWHELSWNLRTLIKLSAVLQTPSSLLTPMLYSIFLFCLITCVRCPAHPIPLYNRKRRHAFLRWETMGSIWMFWM